MDTQKLAHLLAVVEHGTFSEAARMVHLTQPALSRSIQALEDELNAHLFDRGARRAHLTVFGKLVVERAKRIRREEAELKRDIDLLRGGEEGSLAIGVSPAPAALLLQSFLIHMAQVRPKIHLHAETGATQSLLELLRSERIDAIVGDAYVLQQAEDIDITPLNDLRAGMVCRVDHPILQHRQVDIDMILAYPVACTTLSAQMVRQTVEVLGPAATPEEMVTIHCDDLHTLRSIALNTNALLFGVLAISRHERANGQMAEVPLPPDPRRFGRYALAKLSARTVSPTLGVLYDFTMAQWPDLALEPPRRR
jgi:DNA-binding transcriptional LysR family regulator